MLGDCLLHGDHHKMTQECCRVALKFHSRIQRPRASQANYSRWETEDRNAYKRAYEKKVLRQLVVCGVSR